MPWSFTQRLRLAQEKTGSMLCVGLDPVFDKVPQSLWVGKDAPRAGVVSAMCKQLVQKVSPYCCAFKPNYAFWAAMGLEGITALHEVMEFIREEWSDHILIEDAKRGDIGHTAAAYAQEVFRQFGAHAVTLSPYLGMDTLEPYFAEPYASEGRGCIVLCKTSNPGSGDIQDQKICDRVPEPDEPIRAQCTVYEDVAGSLRDMFGSTGNLGLVVGATYPEQLEKIREIIGLDTTLLIPGIGKQGGDLNAMMKANNGGLAVINNSREIMYASAGEDWLEAAVAKARATNDAINALRKAA